VLDATFSDIGPGFATCVATSADAPASPTIAARSYEGLTATTADGKPARFALIDENGNVIASGKQVADAAFASSINAYREFLQGRGHHRVVTPPGALDAATHNAR
jgi:hypothetical protein